MSVFTTSLYSTSISSIHNFNAAKIMLQYRKSINTKKAANQEAQPFNCTY